MSANQFLCLLREQHQRLTRQEIRTLRGQALAGGIDGAVRGLTRLLQKQSAEKP